MASCRHEVIVDSSWCVELPRDCNGIKDDSSIAGFVTDFKAFAEKYGVAFCEKSEKKIQIRIDVVTDDKEYHEIDIKENLITINAASDVGVLRALYDLENLVENAGTFTLSVLCC